MTSTNVTNVRREHVRLPIGARVRHTEDALAEVGTVRGYGTGYSVFVRWFTREGVHDSRKLERVEA